MCISIFFLRGNGKHYHSSGRHYIWIIFFFSFFFTIFFHSSICYNDLLFFFLCIYSKPFMTYNGSMMTPDLHKQYIFHPFWLFLFYFPSKTYTFFFYLHMILLFSVNRNVNSWDLFLAFPFQSICNNFFLGFLVTFQPFSTCSNVYITDKRCESFFLFSIHSL